MRVHARQKVGLRQEVAVDVGTDTPASRATAWNREGGKTSRHYLECGVEDACPWTPAARSQIAPIGRVGG